jgi:CheY-like chemotaxis protein
MGVVKSHGGAIEVLSAPGAGTTFAMTFARASACAARPKAAPASTGAARGLRILAVDDEPDIARMLALMLRDHKVVIATSGEDALDVLGASARDHQPFDVLMTDIGLGAGMTGWELADRARETQPSLPVVLVSGWGASIEEYEAKGRGVHGVIAKPFRNAEIRRVLATLKPGGAH